MADPKRALDGRKNACGADGQVMARAELGLPAPAAVKRVSTRVEAPWNGNTLPTMDKSKGSSAFTHILRRDVRHVLRASRALSPEWRAGEIMA